MRLLTLGDDGELSLHNVSDHRTPPYAILSHTWGEDEVTFDDIEKTRGVYKAGHAKIQFCGDQAKKDGIQYFWVDTCCIDRRNYTELSEAITSMFRWYQDAVKCYVYLSDVTASAVDSNDTLHWWASDFRRSRWFTRGWTLQELLAPASVEFFSREKQLLGNKKTLQDLIHEVTQIPTIALDGAPLSRFSVDERLQWTAKRHTKLPEDKAYCLLGIFGIFMPLRYGEGDHALKRLKGKIYKHLRSDLSIFDNFAPALHTEVLLGTDDGKLPSSYGVRLRRDEDFVDSGNLLCQLEEKCAQQASRVALIGIGGIGKSQLAIEYCHRLHQRSPDTWIFWLYANNAERIEQGYRDIAEQVKIAGRTDLQNNIFESVARWLQDDKANKWLLVLNDLEDDVMLSIPQESASMEGLCGKTGQLKRSLSEYLPHSVNGALLATTRMRSVATKLVKPQDVIAMNSMTKSNAITLLQKKLTVADSDSDLEELASMLEHMPMALVQAASYIQQKGIQYSVRQYIEEFQRSSNRNTNLFDFEGGHLRRNQDAMNSIVITFQMSFDSIYERWPSSADLLALMSFFDRQGIPKEVLTVPIRGNRWAETGGCEDQDKLRDAQDDTASEECSDDYLDQFNEDIDRLRSYSLVSAEVGEQTFKMHGLVQLATRKWLAMKGEDERWRGEFCRRLSAVFPTGEHENWTKCARLFPHAKTAELQRPNDDVRLREWCLILSNAGWYARAKGNSIEAERMCGKAAQQLRRLLGADNIDTLSSMGNLALTYRSQGRLVEAEDLFVKVMETRRRILGEAHPDTLTSMASLASTYMDQGRLVEAEKMEVQVLETRQRVLGEVHPDTLTSMANLSSTYMSQGRLAEAEMIGEEVLETRRRVLGEEHPDTLTSMANLSSTYMNQGRLAEAEKIGVQVLETCQRVLGEKHPDTLISLNNLASTYSSQGRWSEAEKAFNEAVEISQQVLGEEHPLTLSSLNNLASTYRDQGRWAEAERIEVEVFRKYRQVLGEKHPDTLTSMANLASTYSNQGRWTEAEKLEVEVMVTRQQVLGEEHPSTLSSMANLASTYSSQGRWSEAEKISILVIETYRRLLGEEHPSTLSSMANLASAYSHEGRFTEAEKIELEVIENRRRILGERHPDTLTSMANLASTYWNQGRWTDAEKLEAEVVESLRQILGKAHPDTLTSMNNLASTYVNQGRLAEAEKIGMEVMTARRQLMGEEHPDTLTSMNNLAFTIQLQGRQDEAMILMMECVQLQSRVLGDDHPQTRNSLAVLAAWQSRES